LRRQQGCQLNHSERACDDPKDQAAKALTPSAPEVVEVEPDFSQALPDDDQSTHVSEDLEASEQGWSVMGEEDKDEDLIPTAFELSYAAVVRNTPCRQEVLPHRVVPHTSTDHTLTLKEQISALAAEIGSRRRTKRTAR